MLDSSTHRSLLTQLSADSHYPSILVSAHYGTNSSRALQQGLTSTDHFVLESVGHPISERKFKFDECDEWDEVKYQYENN